MKKRIILAVLMLGLVSQVGQVLLLREFLMVFQGNELSIGIILAAWMFWVGFGSFLGGFLANRWGSPIKFLKVTAASMLLVFPVVLLLIRNLRHFFDILPGAYLSLLDITVACFLTMSLPCLFLGIQFVLLAQIWRQKSMASDTLSAGKTYAGEAAGNMIGGILFTFFMVRYLSPLQSAFIIVVLIFIAFMFIEPPQNNFQKFRFFWLILPIFFVLIFPYLKNIDNWAYQAQWKAFKPHYNLVGITHSKHGTISLAEREGQYSFFQSGHLIFSTAGPETLTSELEEQDAVTFAHFSMLQHKNPRRILLLGGGLRGTLSEIVKYPLKSIDYIELDEALTEKATPYVSQKTLDALSDRRLKIKHTDGRLFLRTTKEKYDMIIVDIPDPATAVLNRYYTKEFFRQAKETLSSGGVLVFGATSTPDLRGKAIANRNTAIYHSLRDVFRYVLVGGERFMFFLASDEPGQIMVDDRLLAERFNEYNLETTTFLAQHFRTLLPESQLRRLNWIVRNHGRKPMAHIQGPRPGPLIIGPVKAKIENDNELLPVNRGYFINSDFKPIGYFYTLMFWESLTRADKGRTFKQILGINYRRLSIFLFLPLIIVLILRVGWRQRKKQLDTRFAVIFAVFTTGLSTMAMQIALIFSFQSVYGFIYEVIGIIIAIFMCGLALGAYLANRHIKTKSNLNILALVQIIVFLLAGLIAVFLPLSARIPSPVLIFILFSMFTFVAGIVNGLDFPLAIACYAKLNRQIEKSTGIVYAIELVGACVGAVLASAIIAPMMGVVACCFLAAIAAFLAFLTILASRRSYA